MYEIAKSKTAKGPIRSERSISVIYSIHLNYLFIFFVAPIGGGSTSSAELGSRTWV